MTGQQQQQQHQCGSCNAAHYRSLTILLLLSGVTILWLAAACSQAVEFYMPKGHDDDGETSSRAIVTRKKWDMSKSSNIPEWLVLLSASPKLLREQPDYIYKYDGHFTGFGFLYHKTRKRALMLADIKSVLRASYDVDYDTTTNNLTYLEYFEASGVLGGWDFVRDRPRLRPTDTTWHPPNDTYRWKHLFTFGQTSIGIFSLFYVIKPHNKLGEDPELVNITTRQWPHDDDTGQFDKDKHVENYDDSGPTSTTTKRPLSWWKIPVWKWTDPGREYMGGAWVLPERGLIDMNCWAYSYAYSHDGEEPYEEKRVKPRFWARWPVTPVEPCWETRPLCKFKFDTERAVTDVKDKDTLRPQGYPCLKYQDTGAPIFCSEEKDWADSADPKIELSYIIRSWAEEERPRTNISKATDFGFECYKEQRNEFSALNLQNMTFILQNPTWFDFDWELRN